jgi:hypothetical protein
MNRTQHLNKLRCLGRSQLRELSEERSCHAYFGGTPEEHAHERLLFCSGFRKGVKAGLRGERSVERADARKARGRHGDAAWALGYARGIKYVPALSLPKKKEPPKVGLEGLTVAERRRLKKKGRA